VGIINSEFAMGFESKYIATSGTLRAKRNTTLPKI